MNLLRSNAEWISEIITFLLILLFVYASVSKILDFENFRTEMGQSPLLTKISHIVAPVVIVIELLISIMLTSRKTRRWALLMSFALMTIFTTYIVVVFNFTHYIPCSCGGILGKLGWTEHILFNALFVAMAAAGFLIIPCPIRSNSKQQ